VHCANAVPIFSAGQHASPMVDTLRALAPATQADLHAVRIRLHPCPGNKGGFDQGLDGLGLPMRPELDDHLTATLPHPRDGWSFLLQGASTTWPLESASPAFASLVLHQRRLTCMARHHMTCMARHHRGLVAFDLVGQRHGRLFCTIPAPNSVVI
jgi:hypothetical protein